MTRIQLSTHNKGVGGCGIDEWCSYDASHNQVAFNLELQAAKVSEADNGATAVHRQVARVCQRHTAAVHHLSADHTVLIGHTSWQCRSPASSRPGQLQDEQ